MKRLLRLIPGASRARSSAARVGRYLTDAAERRRAIEKRRDLRATRRVVGRWESPPPAAGPKVFAIAGFTDLPLHAKLQSVVALTMRLRGYRPVIFNSSGNHAARRLYRLFGIEDVVGWNRLPSVRDDQARAFLDGVRSRSMTIPEVTALRFHGVEVGKHALSMTCRRRIEGHLDLDDPATRELFHEQMASALDAVLKAERYFDEHRVDRLLVRDAGYIPNGPIFEVALERAIDCVVYEQGQKRGTWVFKRYTRDTKGRHFFSLSDETWKMVRDRPWTDADEARLRAEFAGRYAPDSTDDTRRLMSGTTVRPADEVRAVLGLDPAKRTAIVFSHLAWDAAFFFGEGLFDDFEHWLYETVSFAAREGAHMNWVVKLHPFNVFKLQREDKSEESEMSLLADLMPLPGHIRIVRADTDINASSLFPVADCVLTVNGTVGMEFPCFSIPALVAGIGRYSGRGFTIDPPTKQAYFDELRRLHLIERLPAEQTELAKKHFLALMTRRQFSLDDVAEMVLLRRHEAQSDVHDNLVIRPTSLAGFGAAGSVRALGAWLDEGTEEDLLEPEVTPGDTDGSHPTDRSRR